MKGEVMVWDEVMVIQCPKTSKIVLHVMVIGCCPSAVHGSSVRETDGDDEVEEVLEDLELFG